MLPSHKPDMARTHFLDVNRILLGLVLALQIYLVYRGNWKYELDRTLPDPLAPVKALIPKPALSSQGRTKFAMGSMNTFETSYDYIAISNKHNYAKKHGYDMIWSFDQPEGGYSKDWDRLTEMEIAIKAKMRGENDYEWIWWTDFDLIVTNSSRTLEEVVEDALSQLDDPRKRDEIDFIITPDCFPVNSGSLLVRTTQYSLDIFKEWWRQKDIAGEETDHRSLQDCLRDMVKDGTIAENKHVFVKQWKMNAFPEEIHCHQDDRPWKVGDFVIHFAGAWAHVKEEDPTGLLMRKYAPMAF